MSAALIKKITPTQYAKIVPARIGYTSSLEDRMSNVETTLDGAKNSEQFGNFIGIDERMEYAEGRINTALNDSSVNAENISEIEANHLRDMASVVGDGPIPTDVKNYFQLKVTQNPDSSLNLDISNGTAFIDGKYVVASEPQTVSITPDEFDNRRIDYVVLNAAGQASVITGAEDGLDPAIPAGYIPLARILVEPALGKVAQYDLNTVIDARNVVDSINRVFYVKPEHIPVNDVTPIELEIDNFLQPEVNYVFDYEVGKLTVNKITIPEDALSRDDERTFSTSYSPMHQGRIFNEEAVAIDVNTVIAKKRVTRVRGVYLASDSEHTGENYFADGSFFEKTITLGTPLPNPNEEVVVDYDSAETTTYKKNALYKELQISGGWSVHGSYTNIFGNSSYGRDSGYHVHEVYEDGTKLVYAESLSDCNTTDGSWTDVETGTIYVNPNANADPASSVKIDAVKVDSNYAIEVELDNKSLNIPDASTTVVSDWKVKVDDYEEAGMVQVKVLAYEDDLTVLQSDHKYLKSVDMTPGEEVIVEDITTGNQWTVTAENLSGLDSEYSARVRIEDANKTENAETVTNYREDGNIQVENLRAWKSVNYNGGESVWGSNSSLSKANYIKDIVKASIPAEVEGEAAGVGPYTVEGDTNTKTFSFQHKPKSGFSVDAEVNRKETVAEALSAGPLEENKGDNLFRWWFKRKPFDDETLVVVYGTQTLAPTLYAVENEVVSMVSVVSSDLQKVITIADMDVDNGTVLTVYDTETGNYWDCEVYDYANGQGKVRLESIDNLDGSGVSLRETLDSLNYNETGGNVLFSNILIYKSFLNILQTNTESIPESVTLNATYQYEIKPKQAKLGEDFIVNTDNGSIDFGSIPPIEPILLRYEYDENKGVVNEIAESSTSIPDVIFKYPGTRDVQFDMPYAVYWSEGNIAVELNPSVDVFDADPEVSKTQYYLDTILGQITFGSAPGVDVRIDYFYKVTKGSFHEVASNEAATHADGDVVSENLFAFHNLPIKGTTKVAVDGRDTDYFSETKVYGEVCGLGDTSDTSTSDDINPLTFATSNLIKDPATSFSKTIELYLGTLLEETPTVVSHSSTEKVISHASFSVGDEITVIDKETENKWLVEVDSSSQVTISLEALVDGNKHFVSYSETDGHILAENLVLIKDGILCTQVAQDITPVTAEEYVVDYITGGITFGLEPATVPIANYVFQPTADNQYCIHDLNGTLEFGATPPTKPNLDYWYFKELPVSDYDPVAGEIDFVATQEFLTSSPQPPYVENPYTSESETDLWKVNLPTNFMEGTGVVETFELDTYGNEVITSLTEYVPGGTFDWSSPPALASGEYYLEQDLGSPYAGNILFGDAVSVGKNVRAVIDTTRYMPTPFERVVVDFDFVPEDAYDLDYDFGKVYFGHEVFEGYQPLSTYDYPYPPVGGGSPMTLSIRYTKEYAIEGQTAFTGEPPVAFANGANTEFYVGELLTISSSEGDIVLETDIETNRNRSVKFLNLSPQIDIGDVVTAYHSLSGLVWKTKAVKDNEVDVDDNSLVLIENEAQTSTDANTVYVTNQIGRVVGVWLAADSDKTGVNFWAGEESYYEGNMLHLSQALPEANAAVVIDYGQTLDDYSLLNSDNLMIFRSAIPVDGASPLSVTVQPSGYSEESEQVQDVDYTFDYIKGVIDFSQVRIVNEADTVSSGNVTADITPLVEVTGIIGVWKKNEFADPNVPTQDEKDSLTNYFVSYNYSNGEINLDITQPGGLANGDEVYIDYLYQNPPKVNTVIRASYTPSKIVLTDKRDMPVNWEEIKDARIGTLNNKDGDKSIDPEGHSYKTVGDRIDSIENALGDDLAQEEGRTVEKRLDVIEGSLGVERVDIGKDKDSYFSDPETYDKENHSSVDNTDRSEATVDARLKLVETAVGNTDYTNKEQVESDSENHLDGRITIEERLNHLEGIIRNCRVPSEAVKPLLDIIDSADYADGYTKTEQIDVGTNESGWTGTGLASDVAVALNDKFSGFGTTVSFGSGRFTISADREMIKIDENFLGEKLGFDADCSQADRTESPVTSHTSPAYSGSSMAFSLNVKNYNGGVRYSEEAYGVSDFWYEYDIRVKAYNTNTSSWEYLKYSPAEVSGDHYGMSNGTDVVKFAGDVQGEPGISGSYAQTYDDATQLANIDSSKGYYFEIVNRNSESVFIGKHGQIMSEAVIQGDGTYAARAIDFGGINIIGEDISITSKVVSEPIQVNYLQADYGKTELTIGNVPASENAVNVRLIAIERGLKDLRETPLKTGEVFETALAGSANTITLPALPAHATLVKGDPTPEWDDHLLIEDSATGQRLTRDAGSGEVQATITNVAGTGEISDPYIITITPTTDTAGSKNLRVHYNLTYELSELPDLTNVKEEIQSMIDDTDMTTWMHYHQIDDSVGTRKITIESEDATEHNEAAHIELNTTQNPSSGSSSVDTKTQNLDIDVSNKMTIDVGHTAGGTDHDFEIEVADTFRVHSDDQIIHNADVEHEINTAELDINVSNDMHAEVTDEMFLESHNLVKVTGDNTIQLNTPQLDINVSDDMHTEVTDEMTIVSHDRVDVTGDNEIELKTALMDVDISNDYTLDVVDEMLVNVGDRMLLHSSNKMDVDADVELEVTSPLLDVDISNDFTLDVVDDMSVNVGDEMLLHSSDRIDIDGDNLIQATTINLDIDVSNDFDLDVLNDWTVNITDTMTLHSSDQIYLNADIQQIINTPLFDINVSNDMHTEVTDRYDLVAHNIVDITGDNEIELNSVMVDINASDEFNVLANDDIIMQANDDVTITADSVLTLHAGTTSTELVMNDQDVTLSLPSNTSTYTVNLGTAPNYGNMEIYGNLTVKGDMTVVDAATSYNIDQLIFGDQSQYNQATADEIYLYGNIVMKSKDIDIDVDAGGGRFDLYALTEIELTSPTIDLDATSVFTLNTPTLQITADSYFSEYIRHLGDSDTYMRFQTDSVSAYAGGRRMISMGEGTDPDILNLGDDSTTCDINLNGDAYIDASSSRMGIGTIVPMAELHVKKSASGGNPIGGADEFSIETSGETGMTILSGASSLGNIYFGDSGNASIGRVVYNHANNQMLFYTNTSQRMMINSSGRIGIGTTNPDHGSATPRLQVQASKALAESNDYDAHLTVSDSTVPNSGNGYNNQRQAGLNFAVRHNSSSTEPISIAAVRGGKDSTANNDQRGYLTFHTMNHNGSSWGMWEHMRITKNGDIGIGTNNPDEKVEIAGIGTNTTNLRLDSGGHASLIIDVGSSSYNSNVLFQEAGSNQYGVYYQGNQNALVFYDYAGSNQDMTIRNNRLGIGTNDPKTVFHIEDDDPRVLIQDVTSATGQRMIFGTSNGYWNFGLGVENANRLSIGPTSTDADGSNDVINANIALNMIGSGYVGIGTTNPNAVFDVNNATSNLAAVRTTRSHANLDQYTEMGTVGGSGRLESFKGNLTIGADANDADGSSYIMFKVDNSEKARIESTGDVGIGTNNPGTRLDILGGQQMFRAISSTHLDATWQSAASSQLFHIFNQGTTGIFKLGFASDGLAKLQMSNNKEFMIADDAGNIGFYLEDGGQVGIGTTVPLADLHIAPRNSNNDGNLKLGARAWFTHDDASHTTTWLANDYNSDSARFGIRMKGVALANEMLTVLGSGRVGIGTTGPGAMLDVDGDIVGRTNNTSNLGNTSRRFANLFMASTIDYANDLAFSSGGEKIRFKTNGRIGVGTSNPVSVVNIFGGESGGNAQSSTMLTLENSGETAMQFLSPNSSANRISFGDPQDWDDGSVKYTHSDRTMTFKAGNVEMVNITNTDVEVTGNLVVRGNMQVVDSATSYSIDTLNFGDVSQYNTGLRDQINMNGDITVKTRLFDINADGTGGVIDLDATSEIELQAPTIDLNATSIMTIDTPDLNITCPTIYMSGDVGIGKTNPADKLHVEGDLRVTGNIYGLVIGAGFTSPTDMTFVIDSDNNESTRRFIWQHNVGAELMTLEESGSLGLGTINPVNELEIYKASGGHPELHIRTGGDTPAILGAYASANAGFLRLTASNAPKVLLQTNGDSYFTGGNVGIGTSGPGYLLEVNGTAQVDSLRIGAITAQEYIEDVVGTMVSGGTENGISVTYNDTAGKLNFDVNDPTISLSGDVSGSATMNNLGNVNIGVTLTKDPVISLSGDASGSVTMSNLGNVTIPVTLTKDPVITLSGDASGSVTMSNLGNVTIPVTLTKDPVITLTGEVTGSGTMTNLGSVSFATTINAERIQDIIGGMVSGNTETGISVTYDDTNNEFDFVLTADPTITLAGDLTGNCTLTNLTNATLTATVQDNSHNHTWSNITSRPDPTIALAGDVTGSAVMTDLGNVTITTSIGRDNHQHSKLCASDGTPDPALSVDASGDVGIGTADASATLDVVRGGVRVALRSYENNSNENSWLAFYKSHTDALGSLATTQNNEALGTISFLGVDTSPQWEHAARIRVFQDGAAGGRVPARMYFSTQNGTVENTNLSILANGNVGVGTTNPLSKLDVVSSTDPDLIIRRRGASSGNAISLSFVEGDGVSNDSSALARIRAIHSGGSPSGDLRFYTNEDGTLYQRMEIDDSGYVGINTDANTSLGRLHVNGTISSSSSLYARGDGAKTYYGDGTDVYVGENSSKSGQLDLYGDESVKVILGTYENPYYGYTDSAQMRIECVNNSYQAALYVGQSSGSGGAYLKVYGNASINGTIYAYSNYDGDDTVKVTMPSNVAQGSIAIHGKNIADQANGDGIGVKGEGGYIGVQGIADSSSYGTPSVGVYGEASYDFYDTYYGKWYGEYYGDFYAGGTGTYAPFTGSHQSTMKSGFSEFDPGMIVSATGNMIKKGISSTFPEIELSDTAQDTTVFGVIIASYVFNYDPENKFGRMGVDFNGKTIASVNSVGEGQIWVTNYNGDIAKGEYVTSSPIPGYGQKQNDDLQHSYTVAKIVESVDWNSVTETIEHEGTPYKKKLLGCTYHCG